MGKRLVEPERYVRVKDVVTRRVAGELVLVPRNSRTSDARFRAADLYVLNDTAAQLWEQLSSATTMEEMVRNLIKEYDLSVEQATADVRSFLDDLVSIGMVETAAGG